MLALGTVATLSLATLPVAHSTESNQVQPSPSVSQNAKVEDAIQWQGPVEGVPGQRLTQDLILDDGEQVKVVVDWHTGLIEIDRSESGHSSIAMEDLKSAINHQTSKQNSYALKRNPRDINWGSLCQWLAGLTGIGHAAIWSIVSPWIGIPYAVFWLWVGFQCK